MPFPRRTSSGRRPVRLAPWQLAVAVALLVVVYLLRGTLAELDGEGGGDGAPGAGAERGAATMPDTVDPSVDRVLRERVSGAWVETSATVERILRDDNDGSRHQRIVVALVDGRTLLLVHNIDLAPRVPARVGDTLRFRGRFEPNDQGGLVHWTHHDPDRPDRPAGWVEHDGVRYR